MTRPVWLPQLDDAWDHARVSRALIKDPRVDALTLAVFVSLALYANPASGACWPSLATLMSDTGLSKNTVRKSLKTLVAAEYLDIWKKPGKADTYLLRFPLIHTGSGDDPPVAFDTETGAPDGPERVTRRSGTGSPDDPEQDQETRSNNKESSFKNPGFSRARFGEARAMLGR